MIQLYAGVTAQFTLALSDASSLKRELAERSRAPDERSRAPDALTPPTGAMGPLAVEPVAIAEGVNQ
jgi:hypothetical protein